MMTRGEPRGGVVFTEGDLWREHRRFALHVLRDFGLSKDLMQERVLDEVSALVGKMKKNLDSGMGEQDVPALLDVAVGSVINTLLFGYRFDEHHEDEFYELKRLIAEDLRAVGGWKFRLLSMYPRLLHNLPPFKAIFEMMKYNRRALSDFYQRQIDEHVKNIDFDTDAVPTDYAEAFLKEKAKRDAEGVEHSFTISQLKGMCSDLFVAGQETTSTTLAWGVAFLVNYPEAQERLHEELDRVIGSDRMVTMADRANLPYTNAVVNEVHRLCNLVPQNIPHTTTKDVTLAGYFLPKGTIVIPQISAVLYDEQVFPEPKVFKPERYLDASGNLKRVDELVQFSIGKRQCLGESLARMEMFLFTANIFNQFSVESGAQKPSLKRTIGATVQCPPYTCRLERRHV
ncbi:Protein CYP-33C9 [Aphelenchoides avenae]|nr:Protein CYP-33C9 [Aphelenchus avenae]KAH7716434.1 Protein CYP-33C9 [Aphelenchus avenae]